MAVKSNNQLTLADLAKRLGPDNKVSKIIEILNQTNPILDDMVFVEGNLLTGHRTTIRTGLPEAFWRMLNRGVPKTKSTTVQVTEDCGMLEAYSEVDKELADLNKNTAEFRLSEDKAFIESMNQKMASTIFYGDPKKNPASFTGLSTRYSDLTADNKDNIIDAGGAGTANTSIWLVVWGDNTVHGTYPQGSTGGIHQENKGQVTLQDEDGNPYEGYRSHYQWKNGLVVRDWRYVVRIANVDVDALAAGTAAPNLIALMAKALHRIPNLTMGRPAFYCNRTISEYLDLQSLEKASLALKVKETEGEFWNTFRNIPIRQCDAIVNGEAQVV